MIYDIQKKFKWLMGGISWPDPQNTVPGYVCSVGGFYPVGYEKPRYYLFAESENESLKGLCRDILEYDISLAPEIWLADKSNEASLAVLRNQNEEVKQVLAGQSYEVGMAPWNRRTVNLSQSPLLEMSNSEDYIIALLNDLLTADRLILPAKSIALKKLHLSKGEKIEFAEHPILQAVGLCVFELEHIAETEERLRNAPPAPKQRRDILRYGIKH